MYPPSLTWNLVFQGAILRFHVKLLGGYLPVVPTYFLSQMGKNVHPRLFWLARWLQGSLRFLASEKRVPNLFGKSLAAPSIFCQTKKSSFGPPNSSPEALLWDLQSLWSWCPPKELELQRMHVETSACDMCMIFNAYHAFIYAMPTIRDWELICIAYTKMQILQLYQLITTEILGLRPAWNLGLSAYPFPLLGWRNTVTKLLSHLHHQPHQPHQSNTKSRSLWGGTDGTDLTAGRPNKLGRHDNYLGCPVRSWDKWLGSMAYITYL